MVRIDLLGYCIHCKGKPNDGRSPIFLYIYLFIRSEDHELNPYLLLLAGRVPSHWEIRFLQFLHTYLVMKLEQVESMVCLRQLYYSHMLLPSQEIERVQDAIDMSYFSDLIHRFET